MRGEAPAVKRSFENYLNVLDFGYKLMELWDILSYINHAEDSANAVETLHKMGKL